MFDDKSILLPDVTSNHALESVAKKESFRHVRSKEDSFSAMTGTDAVRLLRIGPEQLTQETSCFRVLEAMHASQLVNHEVWLAGQAAVNDENLLLNQIRNGHKIHDLIGQGKELMVVLFAAFVVEAVDAIDVLSFVISARHKEAARIGNFEGQQCQQAFNRVHASVNNVTVKQLKRKISKTIFKIGSVNYIFVSGAGMSIFSENF